ncbi:hypothetical protein [Thalassobius sp. I31.1]|uniref:hypothetical protein n=1 Tax=Thalassobius sp. I31.1 TaxID=2109912 RepID=UPI000D1C14DD|nr:hypothetical protein [Thalassobius sp. I31.1]
MPLDDVQQGELHAKWREFVDNEENQRLALLEERIERKKATLKDAISERQKIMARAIRRMRRANGKT